MSFSQKYETTFVTTKAQSPDKQVHVEMCWRASGVKREECDSGYLNGGWEKKMVVDCGPKTLLIY